MTSSRRRCANPRPFRKSSERSASRLPRREIPIVNSSSDVVEFGPELNFLVGGNILGRGLTIENLLVTYYLRKAKTSQMDTVLQHATDVRIQGLANAIHTGLRAREFGISIQRDSSSGRRSPPNPSRRRYAQDSRADTDRDFARPAETYSTHPL